MQLVYSLSRAQAQVWLRLFISKCILELKKKNLKKHVLEIIKLTPTYAFSDSLYPNESV